MREVSNNKGYEAESNAKNTIIQPYRNSGTRNYTEGNVSEILEANIIVCFENLILQQGCSLKLRQI